MKETIIAGIILFNPEINRLEENISSIQTQVRDIVLIDNASNNIKEVIERFEFNNNIQIIKNSENLGIANALNKIIAYAKENECNWVLTLDQDSVAAPNLISEYIKYTDLMNLGMITCQIIDRNFLIKKKEEDKKETVFMNRCITSGCLTNVKACTNVGGFDEKMFIDFVDFDMCNSLITAGYKILKVNTTHILHEVGNKTRIVYLFKKEYLSFNQTPIRNYYFFRNWIYFIRKHMKGFQSFKEFYKLGKQILIVIAFEKKDMKKLIAIFKGLYYGFKMNYK